MVTDTTLSLIWLKLKGDGIKTVPNIQDFSSAVGLN
jgi:hypothetical protein